MAACHTSYEPLPNEWHAAVVVGSKLHMWGGWVEREISGACKQCGGAGYDHGAMGAETMALHQLDCGTLHTQWWGHVSLCLVVMRVSPVTTAFSSLTITLNK